MDAAEARRVAGRLNTMADAMGILAIVGLIILVGVVGYVAYDAGQRSNKVIEHCDGTTRVYVFPDGSGTTVPFDNEHCGAKDGG